VFFGLLSPKTIFKGVGRGEIRGLGVPLGWAPGLWRSSRAPGQRGAQSQAQLAALPEPALALFAEARTVLELAPWNGQPYHPRRPESPMRTLLFGPHGEGKIVYLILEDRRRVDLLVVLWLA
jgi:hypothetical protein